MEQANLETFYQGLAETAGEILGLKREEMTFLFPRDMMQFGLGEDIVVEIDGLGYQTARGINFAYLVRPVVRDAHSQLVRALGTKVQEKFPDARVQAYVNPPNEEETHWSSVED